MDWLSDGKVVSFPKNENGPSHNLSKTSWNLSTEYQANYWMVFVGLIFCQVFSW